MKSRILSIIAAAAALVACSKEVVETVSPSPVASEEGKTISITATFGSSDTRLAYTQQDDGSYSAEFSDADIIWMYFYSADNTPLTETADGVTTYVSPVRAPISPTTISTDKKTAQFIAKDVTIPDGAVTIVAYLAPVSVNDTQGYNTGKTTGSSVNFSLSSNADAVLNLASQTNLNYALDNQIVTGSLNVEDIKSKSASEYEVEIPFAYKTSLLTFELTLPKGTELASDATMVLSGSKLHNAVNLVGSDSNTVLGDIEAGLSSAGYGADSTVIVKAYTCVWAEDDLSDCTLSIEDGDNLYKVDLKPASGISAGKAYTVKRTMAQIQTADVWVNDEAGSMDFAGGTASLTSDFLTYANGTLSWTANTTGEPRSASLSTDSGSQVTITQLTVSDFKDTYSFTTKLFDPNQRVSTGNQNTFVKSVTFGDPRLGETLSDASGNSYTNTVGIQGLYVDGFVVEACVDIDYDNKTLRLGVMFDGRKAQKLSSSIGDYGYAAFLPGLCTTATSAGFGSPWAFVVPDMGEPDYEWLWFETENLGQTFSYIPANGTQQLSTVHSLSTTYICGMSLVLCSSEECTADTVASSYDVVYQYNTGNSMATGQIFERQ